LILSLDSNVLVDLVNQRWPIVRRRYDQAVAAGDTMLTCSFAAQEVLYAASISARPSAQLAGAHALFDHMVVAEFSLEDAAAAAGLRADLKRAGQSIGAFDTLIAGQALRRGWGVVTGNVREFGRVPGLQVIDWTAEAESA